MGTLVVLCMHDVCLSLSLLVGNSLCCLTSLSHLMQNRQLWFIYWWNCLMQLRDVSVCCMCGILSNHFSWSYRLTRVRDVAVRVFRNSWLWVWDAILHSLVWRCACLMLFVLNTVIWLHCCIIRVFVCFIGPLHILPPTECKMARTHVTLLTVLSRCSYPCVR